MNLLIVDENEEFFNLVEYIKEIIKYEVFKANNFNKAKRKYIKNNISIVIIDVDIDFGEKFLEYIVIIKEFIGYIKYFDERNCFFVINFKHLKIFWIL